MNEVAEDSALATMTQFLAEVQFRHLPPCSWENETGGREFVINAHTSLDNGVFKVHIQGDEQSQFLIFYCIWDIHIPPRKRQEISELITRLNYNLYLGNFEMDFYDGEVRFKSTLAYEGIPLNFANLRAHFYACLRMMDRCAPWTESVIISEYTPEKAAELAKHPPQPVS